MNYYNYNELYEIYSLPTVPNIIKFEYILMYRQNWCENNVYLAIGSFQ